MYIICYNITSEYEYNVIIFSNLVSHNKVIKKKYIFWLMVNTSICWFSSGDTCDTDGYYGEV